MWGLYHIVVTTLESILNILVKSTQEHHHIGPFDLQNMHCNSNDAFKHLFLSSNGTVFLGTAYGAKKVKA